VIALPPLEGTVHDSWTPRPLALAALSVGAPGAMTSVPSAAAIDALLA